MAFSTETVVIDNIEYYTMYKPVPKKPKYPICKILKWSIMCLLGSFESAKKIESLIDNYIYSKRLYYDFQKIKDTVEYDKSKENYAYLRTSQVVEDDKE